MIKRKFIKKHTLTNIVLALYKRIQIKIFKISTLIMHFNGKKAEEDEKIKHNILNKKNVFQFTTQSSSRRNKVELKLKQ